MATETCYRHPTRLAVEHCEVCSRPVCGSCLWYAENGQRLCPDHAAERLKAGETVTPPEKYAEGIVHSEASAAQAGGGGRRWPYQGNSTDLSALVAGLIGVGTLLSCFGLAWALPFLAFGLGLVAWLQAKDAADPHRTRWLAGLGLAGGGIYLLFILGWFLLVLMCMLPVWISIVTAGPQVNPIPTPLPVITPFAP
jgi:hypothetical protein